jgi:hypothetical protein
MTELFDTSYPYPELVSLTDAAEILRVRRVTVQEMAKDGMLPGAAKMQPDNGGQRLWRIPYSSVQLYRLIAVHHTLASSIHEVQEAVTSLRTEMRDAERVLEAVEQALAQVRAAPGEQVAPSPEED